MDKETEKAHLESVLSEEIAKVDTKEQAREVLRKAEQLAGPETQEQRGEEAAQAPGSAVDAVDRASESGSPTTQTAAALTTAAAEAVAPTPEAPLVGEAAERVVRPTAPISPRTQRGLELLREALLEQMRPHEAIDARAYLAVNSLPHPAWLDRLANTLTVIFNGGWIWLGATAAAAILGAQRGPRAIRDLAPALIVTTWIVEHPVKSFFRRKRPFIDIVRALVVGKKPGTWSFPSGHTASSFAAAWLLSRCWPERAPAYFSLAGLIGFSRTYVGAHYPGDVLAGAAVGITLAESSRRLFRYLFQMVRNR